MKILHIGKQGNLQRFAAADGFLNSLDLVDLKPDLPVEEYLSQAGDADFIVADAIAAVPGALIRQMPNLLAIHSEGVAFNAIDLKAADECGAIIPLRVTLEIIKVSFLRGFSYAQLFDNGQAQAAQRLPGFRSLAKGLCRYACGL